MLQAYPKETVVAEKLEAVTALEMLNSRMKDFFDLWALSRLYDFDGPILLKAIKATFDHRATAIEMRPVGLEDEFANDRTKSTQWTAFVRRSHLNLHLHHFMKLFRLSGTSLVRPYPPRRRAARSIRSGEQAGRGQSEDR